MTLKIDINNSKVHGEIDGIPVGTTFNDRRELAEANVHGRPLWGIHGTDEDGAYAIVLNGQYEDDDQGEIIIYTGHGKGKAKGETTTPFSSTQIGNQEWRLGNKALKRSCENRLPVRVIRGPDGNSKYCPLEGYRYDGLYDVVRCWQEKDKKGEFLLCKFELRRSNINQPRLPRPTDAPKWWDWRNLRLKPPVNVPEQKFAATTSIQKKRKLIAGKRRLGELPRISKKSRLDATSSPTVRPTGSKPWPAGL
ncbi:PUA-like domain-containing protein [Crucibulum laeve]|uniref:PUA-like domain-containing protein n=1 Tax=Crucibulum laeve TaxID=68775 RepID=A0A5C3M8J1_9AGAR|nr:PUA-like domain-containing protein [Crucibulum laeve]